MGRMDYQEAWDYQAEVAAARAKGEQGELQVLKAPDPAMMGDGEGVLVVADLVDSGRTLELVRQMYPKAHFATVYAKPKGQPMVETYITEVSQDTWILFPWDTEPQYAQPIASSRIGGLPPR